MKQLIASSFLRVLRTGIASFLALFLLQETSLTRDGGSDRTAIKPMLDYVLVNYPANSDELV